MIEPRRGVGTFFLTAMNPIRFLAGCKKRKAGFSCPQTRVWERSLRNQVLSVHVIVVCKIHERDLPFLLFKFIRQDIVPDMQPSQSLHGPVKRLSDLRVLAKFPEFFDHLLKPGSVLFAHLPESRLNLRIWDNGMDHSEMALTKASIDSYVFPFPFAISAWARFTRLTNSGLMADSGG